MRGVPTGEKEGDSELKGVETGPKGGYLRKGLNLYSGRGGGET